MNCGREGLGGRHKQSAPFGGMDISDLRCSRALLDDLASDRVCWNVVHYHNVGCGALLQVSNHPLMIRVLAYRGRDVPDSTVANISGRWERSPGTTIAALPLDAKILLVLELWAAHRFRSQRGKGALIVSPTI
jgi:hypothetical protein